MILATAFDSNYKWGPGWRKSLEENCNVPFEIIDMDHVETKISNKCLQHGEFLDYLSPDIADSDVVMFSDADCVMQRGFGEREKAMFDSLEYGQIAADFVFDQFRSLLVEANGLGRVRRYPGDEFKAHFDGFQTMPTWCTAVVAARKDTWTTMRKWFERYWAYVDSLWHHYAKQQWLMSYIMNRYLQPVQFPPSITQHSFRPVQPGMTFDGDTVLMNGEPIVIRHALNLDPPKKGVMIPKEAMWEQLPTSSAPQPES